MAAAVRPWRAWRPGVRLPGCWSPPRVPARARPGVTGSASGLPQPQGVEGAGRLGGGWRKVAADNSGRRQAGLLHHRLRRRRTIERSHPRFLRVVSTTQKCGSVHAGRPSTTRTPTGGRRGRGARRRRPAPRLPPPLRHVEPANRGAGPHPPGGGPGLPGPGEHRRLPRSPPPWPCWPATCAPCWPTCASSGRRWSASPWEGTSPSSSGGRPPASSPAWRSATPRPGPTRPKGRPGARPSRRAH